MLEHGSFLDRESLLERLRGIEWDDFEAKEAAREVPKSAYAAVSAFANSAGGWIVFGVKETRAGYRITGVSDPDTMQSDFLGACRSTEKFSRPVDVKPRHLNHEGKVVLAFYVMPAKRFEKPIRVRIAKTWKAYIRVGGSNQLCNQEEEARFLRDASFESYGSLLLDGASAADLDQGSLSWLRGLIAQRSPELAHLDLSAEDYLEEIGLIRDGQLTHAAALLFGREKLLARLVPGGVVDFRLIYEAFSEELPAHRYDDREVCELNLVHTLRALLERFLRLVPNPFELDPETWQRRPHPPEYTAVRECLVNLLIHQDYSDRQRTARILWYNDRTIFDNPGDSYVSVGEMLEGGASDLRNPLIARLFRQSGHAEQAGTGVPSIVRTWRAAERRPPRIDNHPGKKLYSITLDWRPQPKYEDAFWKQLIGASVSADEARVLEWARGNGMVDRSHARLATGRTARDTARMLDRLVVNQLLEPVDEEGDQFRLVAHIAEILARRASEGSPGTKSAPRDQVGTKSAPSGDQGTKSAPSRHQVGTKSAPSPDQVDVLRSALEPRRLLALMEPLGRSDRTKFRRQVVGELLERGLLEMTIPDKPTSSRQRYVTTEAGRAWLRGLEEEGEGKR